MQNNAEEICYSWNLVIIYNTVCLLIKTSLRLNFRSYVRESGKADREGDKMAASMEKKIAELEMGLLHLQQNIDIPEITLIVHPEVAKIIKKAAESNIKPNVSSCYKKCSIWG